MIRSGVLYNYYEFKSKKVSNMISIVLFTLLIILSFFQRKNFFERSNYDNILIKDVIFYLVYIRAILVGVKTPYDILDEEINKNKLYHKASLIRNGCNTCMYFRIFTKLIMGALINVITTVLVEMSIGVVYDIRNYFILSVYVLASVFVFSIIGYMIAVLGVYLSLKRELVVLLEMIVVILFVYIKNYTKYLPISIVGSDINSVLYSDIVFSQVENIDVKNIIYYTILFLIANSMSYFSLCRLQYALSKKRINGGTTKNENK